MSDDQRLARESLAGAAQPEKLQQAVVRFHKRVDDILERSHRSHATEIACMVGCSLCCSLQVEVVPPEAFALAGWLLRRFAPAALQGVITRLRANVARIRAMGIAARRNVNMPCALLGPRGECTAYEARPAQCRRFHSTDLDTCKASFANPGDDTVLSPMDPLVAHNAQVVITLAQHGMRDEGLDATPVDMNVALLAAIEDGKAWRRWRSGKKPFPELPKA
jgi:Fe-S-cluster containining protein